MRHGRGGRRNTALPRSVVTHWSGSGRVFGALQTVAQRSAAGSSKKPSSLNALLARARGPPVLPMYFSSFFLTRCAIHTLHETVLALTTICLPSEACTQQHCIVHNLAGELPGMI